MSDHPNISTIPFGAMTSEAMASLREMDKACVAAINLAARRGVPQGLIVGLLHGYAHVQTAIMMTTDEE
jgi:hypothetical protein